MPVRDKTCPRFFHIKIFFIQKLKYEKLPTLRAKNGQYEYELTGEEIEYIWLFKIKSCARNQ